VKKKVHEHQIHCWKEKIGPLFAINCEGWPLLNRPAMRTVKKKVKIYKNKRSSFRVSGCLKNHILPCHQRRFVGQSNYTVDVVFFGPWPLPDTHSNKREMKENPRLVEKTIHPSTSISGEIVSVVFSFFSFSFLSMGIVKTIKNAIFSLLQTCRDR
jgi:hypothetical protein